MKQAFPNRLFIFLLITCFIVSLLAGDSVDAASASLPVVTKVEGKVEMKRPRERKWVLLVKGLEIPQKARIQTKLGARVQIKLHDGSTITLKENSIFEVVRSRKRHYDFRLWVGGARAKVSSLQPGSRFTVRTSLAVAGIRGTDFLLQAEESGKTVLSVYEGKVEFRSSVTGQQALVEENQSAIVNEGGDLLGVTSGTADDENADFASDGSTTLSSSTSTEDLGFSFPLFISAPKNGDVVVSRSITVLGSATPGAEVLVNGNAAATDASGLYTAAIALSEGENRIEVTSGSDKEAVTITVDSLAPVINI